MSNAGIFAAAGILMRGGKVLGFVRENEGAMGLPCGKLEEGESAADACIREMKEETGYDVRTIGDPYIDYDPVGGCVVAAFICEVAAVGFPTHPHEGSPIWVSISDLLQSKYKEYNRRALSHFKIAPAMRGKYHSHLTIKGTEKEAERARDLVGGKVTIIELERSQVQQVDIMLTHHFVAGNKGLEDHYDVLASLKAKAHQLSNSGINVIRVKVEHELFDERSRPEDVMVSLQISDYIETHIKCEVSHGDLSNLKAIASEMGWHPSRNPRQQGAETCVQFVNRRFYGILDLPSIEGAGAEIVARISPICKILEVKMETAIFDDNGGLDAWWMKQ